MTNKTVTVKIKVDNHWHAGMPCAKGQEIEVSAGQAERLVDAKKAERVTDKSSVKLSVDKKSTDK